MTNGEKMQEIFPEGKTRKCIGGVVFESNGWCHAYDSDWWNAEYKEPTAKNDLPYCQHTDEEIAKSFIEDVEAVKDQLPCGEQMDFPSTFDEFAKDYGFKDKDEIYTNGSELIQVFRVKQWLEHISTTKNDLDVDCISRKAVFETIDDCNRDGLKGIFCSYNDGERFKEYIKNLPPITPQEPRKEHWIDEGFYAEGHSEHAFMCSECGWHFIGNKSELVDYKYCPFCGAKMVEPQKSEDKE